MIWTNNEDGPTCYGCGYPTVVKVFEEDGKEKAILLCLFHTKEEGACWSLPSEHKPEGWPKLPDEEIHKLILEGQAEENAHGETQDEGSGSS